MRILHIISSPAAGGAEIYIKDLAKALTQKGLTIYIGFLNRASDFGRSIEFEKNFLSELSEAGIKYFFIGNQARKNPLSGMLRVRKYCREHNIDIYHSHLKFGIIFGVSLKIPRIYTHHNIVPEVSMYLYNVFNLFVESYVGISPVCADKLAQYTGRSVTTIMNGVDQTKLFPYLSQRNSGAALIQCIAVGRIQPQKNYKLLIEALRLVPADISKLLRVFIAGEGPAELTKELEDLIAHYGLSNTVSLLGNRSDIPQLLGKSQVFLMTSAWEGLPIALIEATLSGLPCIVTNVGGCSEVINACQNGFVVDPNNPEAFADAICEVVETPDLLAKLSSNALNNSVEFTIDHAADGHIALYRSLAI